MKIDLDKYYTDDALAKRCIETCFSVIGRENITEIIEPSAGNGAFSKQIENCISYDIEPEDDSIMKQDFLTLELPYKKGRLIIGNPPFGVHNALIRKFFVKSVYMADYVAFILPISQLDNNLELYEFDLIHSEDLGVMDYSGRQLHCCFNVFRIPEFGFLNEKPDFTLRDITIIEHRRHNDSEKSHKIPAGFDYSMCNWGNGCLGKTPEYVGQYAQEVYFYCHKKEFLDKMLQMLEYDTIRSYCKSISSKRISVMRLYKYLKENIDGIK